MKIFLSYAEEDSKIAKIIAGRLEQEKFGIFYWEDPRQRGKRFIQEIEQQIGQAQAFLAVLSRSYLGSYWCSQERDMAFRREQELRAGNQVTTFINVVKVADVSPSDAGFLGSYDWLDMSSHESRDRSLGELVARLSHPGRLLPGTPGAQEGPGTAPTPPSRVPSTSNDELIFRNRQDELDRVLRGLTNASGPHFWLVVAPPQLGKTWFLERISAHEALIEPAWVVRIADIRQFPADVREDAPAILARLFGRAQSGSADELGIAGEIIDSHHPHLCLLDSAELLSERTVSALRACLSHIYRLVHDSGRPNLRLALIVASRRDDEWKGIAPGQRLSVLPLTEFKADVVQQALHDLSGEMGTSFYPEFFRANAARVHQLSEGMPALLVRCLQWVRKERWLKPERLETADLFETLACPYIRQGLLTAASLLPSEAGEADEALWALVQACRVLAPYRLFTQSHLRHHMDIDPVFRAALEAAGWELPDLWTGINNTALLRRPLDEPWQEIRSAIRRLLYRYFYKTDEQRAQAHGEARKFVEAWADRQVGTEQVVSMVECLWHEAAVLKLRNPAEMEQELTESAGTLASGLRESPAYSLPELRSFAAERMKNDVEFQEAVGDIGLFNRLIDIVARS
jgi:TIR domain-containing protein